MKTLFTSLLTRTLPPAGAPMPFGNILRASTAALCTESTEKKLCQKLARTFQVPELMLCHSGRSALSLILTALHKSLPKSEQNTRLEVLIPAYVSYSVPSAVAHAGFTLRLYDVDPQSLAPNKASIQAATSEKTLAIVLCHQFGLVYDGAPLRDIATAHGAFLVDDAAQVMGAMVGKDYAGTMGHVGLFSLSRGKAVTAVEGGIIALPHSEHKERIATALEQCAQKSNTQKNSAESVKMLIKAAAFMFLRQPAVYTLPASLPWLQLGASIFEPNFPHGAMCSASAGLAQAALPLMEASHGRRRHKAAYYARALQDIAEVKGISPAAHTRPVYVRYPLVPTKGKEIIIQKILRHNGGKTAKKLGISRGFPLPLYAVNDLQPHLTQEHVLQKTAEQRFMGATYVAQNLITLPTHDHVRKEDMDTILEFLAKMCR